MTRLLLALVLVAAALDQPSHHAAAADGPSGPSVRAAPSPLPPAAGGHVFVLNTDIRLLACDVWLLPVTREMEIDRAWAVSPEQHPPRPRGFGKEVLAVACREKTESSRRRRAEERFRTYESPLPIVADVLSTRGGGRKRLPELLEALRQFLALAAAETASKPPRFGRALPLIAVPIFGAGLSSDELLDFERGASGGGSGEAQLELGEIIAATLDSLRAFTRAHAVDVALCTVDSAAFGAALNARRARDPEFAARAPAAAADPAGWAAEVQRLAQVSGDGQLALFLGAGVSINAGLPSWPQLLEQLARAVGLGDSARAQLRLLDPLEAATVCAARAGGEAALKRLASAILGGAKRHSLQHALLAALPFRGAITTNYDELFEQAVRCAGGDLAVLPAQVGTVREAWLLKMHGTVVRPDSMVLTRADYVRFSKEQAASEGVLQGLLLTQHVLFVGFGMRDENWCRISASVEAPFREAARDSRARADADPSQQPPPQPRARGLPSFIPHRATAGPPPADQPAEPRPLLGTVLSLQADGVLDELWSGLLHVSPIDTLGAPAAAAPGGGRALAAHARSLEVFLDHLVSEIESKRCRVLLNPKFGALLSPRSRALRLALEKFLAELPEDAKRSAAFKQLLPTLLVMGLRTEALRSLVADPTLEGPYHRRMSKLAPGLPSNVRAYRYVLEQSRRTSSRGDKGGR